MKLNKFLRPSRFIWALLLLSLIPRIFIALEPIDSHEALYAQPIAEFMAEPKPFLTYLGTPSYYKPPLTIYIYSALVYPLVWLPLPFELIYRLPSVLFGVLSIYIFYLLIKNLFGEETALISAFIFSLTNLVIASQTALLTDSLANFLILLSVFLYTKRGKRNFLFACLFSALAFLSKSVLSFIIPSLAV